MKTTTVVFMLSMELEIMIKIELEKEGIKNVSKMEKGF